MEEEVLYVVEGDDKSEEEMIEWLKAKATTEYAKKGYTVLDFALVSIEHESSHRVERTAKSMLRGSYGKMTEHDNIRARVKVTVQSNGDDGTVASQTVEEEEPSKQEEDKDQDKGGGGDKEDKGGDKGGDKEDKGGGDKENINTPPFPKELLSKSKYSNGDFLTGLSELQKMLNTKLPVAATTFFQLMLSNEGTFEHDYHEKRGDTDITVGEWKDDGKGMRREVKYTLKLSGPVGPPTSRAVETHCYNLQPNKLIWDISMVPNRP